MLSVTTIMKSLKGLDALLLLADAGYGNQAMMMARTLFEDSVIAWWCSKTDPMDLQHLLEDHAKSTALLLQRDTPGRADFPMLKGMPTLEPEVVEQLKLDENLDERRARNLWTGRGVASMVSEIEEEMSPADRVVLRQIFDLGYLLTNLAVHHSPMAMDTVVKAVVETESERINVISRQPSKVFVHEALAVGYHSLSLTARLLCPAHRSGKLDELLQRDRRRFIVIDRSGRPGRNGLCPCGSGRKYKYCHGA